MTESFDYKPLFSLLSKMSIQMTAILDVDELITFFVNSISEIFQSQRASLMLLDQSKKELFLKTSHGVEVSDAEKKLKPGEMFGGWVLEHGEPLLVQDIDKEYPHLAKEKASQYQSKSFVIAPIKLRDGVMGILSVTDRKDGAVFTNDDVKIINTLCHWLAIHIENIKLTDKNTNLIAVDSLTRLFNHRYLQEQLVEEIYRAERYKRSVSVLMLDIDNFDSYNKTLSFQAGDIALRQIGRILRDNIRRIDIAGRFGPEEFMIILPETGLEQAIFVGEKIREAISYSFLAEDSSKSVKSLKLTVSIGVSEYKTGSNKETMLQSSLDALLKAKQKGKNCVCSS